MPVVDVTFDGRRWHVALYAGGHASATTREGIELVVRHVLPGTALRFIDAPAESASRPPAQAEPAPNLAEHRALDLGQATEAPIPAGGASTPPAVPKLAEPPSATRAGTGPGNTSTAPVPARALEVERPSGLGGGAQLPLPLAAAP